MRLLNIIHNSKNENGSFSSVKPSVIRMECSMEHFMKLTNFNLNSSNAFTGNTYCLIFLIYFVFYKIYFLILINGKNKYLYCEDVLFVGTSIYEIKHD